MAATAAMTASRYEELLGRPWTPKRHDSAIDVTDLNEGLAWLFDEDGGRADNHRDGHTDAAAAAPTQHAVARAVEDFDPQLDLPRVTDELLRLYALSDPASPATFPTAHGADPQDARGGGPTGGTHDADAIGETAYLDAFLRNYATLADYVARRASIESATAQGPAAALVATVVTALRRVKARPAAEVAADARTVRFLRVAFQTLRVLSRSHAVFTAPSPVAAAMPASAAATATFLLDFLATHATADAVFGHGAAMLANLAVPAFLCTPALEEACLVLLTTRLRRARAGDRGGAVLESICALANVACGIIQADLLVRTGVSRALLDVMGARGAPRGGPGTGPGMGAGTVAGADVDADDADADSDTEILTQGFRGLLAVASRMPIPEHDFSAVACAAFAAALPDAPLCEPLLKSFGTLAGLGIPTAVPASTLRAHVLAVPLRRPSLSACALFAAAHLLVHRADAVAPTVSTASVASTLRSTEAAAAVAWINAHLTAWPDDPDVRLTGMFAFANLVTHGMSAAQALCAGGGMHTVAAVLSATLWSGHGAALVSSSSSSESASPAPRESEFVLQLAWPARRAAPMPTFFAVSLLLHLIQTPAVLDACRPEIIRSGIMALLHYIVHSLESPRSLAMMAYICLRRLMPSPSPAPASIPASIPASASASASPSASASASASPSPSPSTSPSASPPHSRPSSPTRAAPPPPTATHVAGPAAGARPSNLDAADAAVAADAADGACDIFYQQALGVAPLAELAYAAGGPQRLDRHLPSALRAHLRRHGACQTCRRPLTRRALDVFTTAVAAGQVGCGQTARVCGVGCLPDALVRRDAVAGVMGVTQRFVLPRHRRSRVDDDRA
ncbi:hypothetical protein CXG81DRAFT_19749 [Caulochytrium protostelioides]|uniref:Uncharacterized protein n=1 Tax=Caulochytrium protostelioides TaxID=1555241 RepID=A0A4P9X5B5_9FUNG|nr:hypothetical protein CXG81DRAFT_19749 [Caulochytrium protostelioides]|eukprot:RKP00285.1 hypothetical protein CXG81DRAFT_19749 [Caulochytrium protostelioides]